MLDERTFTVAISEGQLHVDATEPRVSDVSLTCSPTTLYELLCRTSDISTAIDDGDATIDGDRSKLRLLVATVPAPA